MEDARAVVVDGLRKTFRGRKGKEVVAVDGVTFAAEAGEIFGLLGPNGAGKTTTLRMISTALRPTGGRAAICGHDLAREPHRVRASIGFLSGGTGVYGRLTPREMVRYFGRLFGMADDAIERRIDEVFGLLDMADFQDRRCDKLSTGQKQKVSIARTIVHDPPVIVLDEPTSGLDVLTSRTIVSFILDRRDAGRCVLLSTHIMSEAEKLCDRIGILHRGRIFAVGTVDELRARAGINDLEEAFVRIVGEASA